MVYLQVQSNRIITDCISYPYGDYIPYDGEVPQAVHGGWHKLIDGVIVAVPELNPHNLDNQIKEAIDTYTMDLIIEGVI